MDDNGVRATGEPPPGARKRTVLVASAVTLLVVLSVGGYLALRAQAGSPAEAVTSIASAAMKGDADSVAASIDTTSLVDSAVDEVFSSTDQTSALVAAYMKKHPDATKAQVKAKLRTTLDEEIREHVKSGTLPKRIPLGSDSLKALVAAGGGARLDSFGEGRWKHRARRCLGALQGQDAHREGADATFGQ